VIVGGHSDNLQEFLNVTIEVAPREDHPLRISRRPTGVKEYEAFVQIPVHPSDRARFLALSEEGFPVEIPFDGWTRDYSG